MPNVKIDSRRPGILWVLNLDWPLPPDVEPRCPTTFTHLSPDSALGLAQAMGCRESTNVLHRFGEGRRCYAAQVEGAIAAYGWVTFTEEEIGEMRLRLRLRPGEAYIWDCATLPAFRRNRLYPALLRHISGELRAAGLCRVWIGTALDNLPSQNGVALAGFRAVADLVVERVVGMRQAWICGRDGVPESLVADARQAVFGDRDQAWRAAFTLAGHSRSVSTLDP